MTSTAGRTVALIGGSGFVGTALAPRMRASGWTVRIVDVAEPADGDFAFHRADVRDLAAMTKALDGCSLVVNLAAAHRDDVRPVSLYHDVNVTGAENVCAASQARGINDIIFTSSVAIYGFQEGEPDEQSPALPFNHYGKTKWEAEKVYRAWQDARSTERKLTIVRPTVVFGPGNRGNVYTLIAQLASGFFVMVGSGENRKSMAYVENVAAFLDHVADADREAGTATYNYVDKPDFSMNALLATVRQALGKSPSSRLRLPYAAGIAAGATFDVLARASGRNFPISKVRVEKFCANTVFSADRLRETGFVAPYDLRQALLETIRHEFAEKVPA